MRYRLRTLLIVLALGPLVLAGAWFLTDAIFAVGVSRLAVPAFIMLCYSAPLWIPLSYLSI
jgi:hypothetical protein